MSYFGGKNGTGTYHTIINQIPPHYVYVELFAGSAAIYKNKATAAISILNDKVPAVVNDLKKWVAPGTIVLNCDAISQAPTIFALLQLIHNIGFPVFMYLDPPYPLDSRKSQKLIYEFEMSDKDHIALLNDLRSISFPAAISTYDNEIYQNQLSSWRKIHFQSTTRHGQATETLYMNYPEPSQLHDYRYIGKSFREREAINRSLKNTARKISAMPALEKQALFNLFLDSNFNTIKNG